MEVTKEASLSSYLCSWPLHSNAQTDYVHFIEFSYLLVLTS